ncbi:MAG: ABC transporter ATP-binding protein [Candidatus Limivicinus sp.]|jgi:NitT/TauT family transport system ATP-binding protein
MPKIEVKNLSFSYQNGKTEQRVLDNINLQVNDGEFLCLIGPTGCGKTTFLRLLSGLERPSSGEIKIDGRSIQNPGPDRMIVFQDCNLFPWLNVLQNVSFAVRKVRSMKKSEADALAILYLEKLGLKDARNLYPGQLSGGMKQKTAIARAVALDSRILLMDEAFSALDEHSRQELQDFLYQVWLSGGQCKKTIIFVTHNISEALLLGERTVLMAGGKIIDEVCPGFRQCGREVCDKEIFLSLASKLRRELNDVSAFK